MAAAAAATTADFLVGATIGEGAYGKVVHARHKNSAKDVAIKVMTKCSIQKDKTMDNVMKERRLLSELKSEHVVSLWASFHDSECLYFVMECAMGGDLAHVIRSGLKEIDEWSAAIPCYSLQILAALEFLHSRHVIHADLKPENCLVTEAGKLKLADFGAAIELAHGISGEPLSPSKEQQQGVRFMGTSDYASPEVVRGETHLLSVGVDLWSLGCLLYAMWEGASPFHDHSDALAIRRIVQYCDGEEEEQVLPPTRNVSDNWAVLIRDLLSPEPSKRIGVISFDGEINAANRVYAYTSIRERECLRPISSPGRDEVPFRAPKPSWWVDTQSCAKRDGAEGWSAFFL